MTETTRFVSKGTAMLLLLLVAAIVVLLTWMAQERYLAEEQRECMTSVNRPNEWESDYAKKEFDYATNVRECLSGE